MERVLVNGVELEYTVEGAGDAVVLLHGGLLCDENTPLSHEPGLTSKFRVVNYHRRGFAGSSHPQGKASIGDQVADCQALLQHLGIQKAHVVGHSLGGVIAMQLALDAPDTVQSLALMEPAVMGAFAKAEAAAHSPGGPAGRPAGGPPGGAAGGTPGGASASQQEFMAGMQKVNEVFATGDRRGALMTFLQTRAGEAFTGVLDWLQNTGEFDQAVRDADTFLMVEMPAAYAWNFTPADAGRIKQPVVSILGAQSPKRARKVHQILQSWMPQTEELILPNAEHALALMDPPGIAAAVASFFDQHPIAAK